MANPNTNTQYTGGFHDDPLHSVSGSQGWSSKGIAGTIDDAFGLALFGEQDWSSQIMGELLGYNSQQREFAMQEYMTDKQNRWNSAQEQMKRAKEAGINPLTAAGGIAGNGTSSAAPPESSAAGAAAGGLNALTGAVGSLGRLGAQNDLDKAIAQDYNAKRDPAIQNIVADTYKKYKEAGYTDLQAQGLAIANAYLPAEKFLGIVAMNSNIDVLKGQYANLRKDIDVKQARINEINKSIDEMGAHISLMEKQALTEEARKLQIEAETAETNWFNLKRQELGIDPKSPIENQLFMMGVTGNPNYTKGMQIVYDTQYNKSLGNTNAINTSDALFGRVGSWADAIGRASQILGSHTDYIIGGLKGIVNGIGSAPKASAIRKELRMILDNAYDQLEQYPEDGERISQVIDDMKAALNLSNAELVKWYNLTNK